jgi:release factor glutamine methyltransferase
MMPNEPGAVDTTFTVAALVDSIAVRLAAAGIADAANEARDLVAAVAGQGRFWPRLHASERVGVDVLARASDAASRRATGMPFAYAVGRAAFRHLTLLVNEHVLIPRQETEVLVDLVLERRRTGVCADIGTGSGAIALALAAEGAYERIVATDVSLGAGGAPQRRVAADEAARDHNVSERGSARTFGRRAIRRHRVEPAIHCLR